MFSPFLTGIQFQSSCHFSTQSSVLSKAFRWIKTKTTENRQFQNTPEAWYNKIDSYGLGEIIPKRFSESGKLLPPPWLPEDMYERLQERTFEKSPKLPKFQDPDGELCYNWKLRRILDSRLNADHAKEAVSKHFLSMKMNVVYHQKK